MLGFRKKEQAAAVSVQTRPEESFRLGRAAPPGPGERALYRALREKVPIIDASINKLRRLLGSFVVECPDEAAQRGLRRFLEDVPVGAAGQGIDSFLGVYFEELLTYGNAVGEMVVSGGQVAALYNASLESVELEQAGPLEVKVSVWDGAQRRPCPYPELLLVSALNPEAGSARGTSLLRGLPFVSEILLKIYHTLGVNWDRLGNVRFAVTCKPDPSGLYAGERARQMAQEWQRAMRSSQVSDFVAVGDVSIQAIGADNQILDSEVPVRQMLEQIVAKLGVPPSCWGSPGPPPSGCPASRRICSPASWTPTAGCSPRSSGRFAARGLPWRATGRSARYSGRKSPCRMRWTTPTPGT